MKRILSIILLISFIGGCTMNKVPKKKKTKYYLNWEIQYSGR